MMTIEKLAERVRRLEDRDSDNAESPGPQCEAPMKHEGPKQFAYREVARSTIESTIKRLQSDADSLQALLNALPSVLSPEADQALWGLVQRYRGRGE